MQLNGENGKEDRRPRLSWQTGVAPVLRPHPTVCLAAGGTPACPDRRGRLSSETSRPRRLHRSGLEGVSEIGRPVGPLAVFLRLLEGGAGNGSDIGETGSFARKSPRFCAALPLGCLIPAQGRGKPAQGRGKPAQGCGKPAQGPRQTCAGLRQTCAGLRQTCAGPRQTCAGPRQTCAGPRQIRTVRRMKCWSRGVVWEVGAQHSIAPSLHSADSLQAISGQRSHRALRLSCPCP
jgi:hypothetical protein